jgi:phosphotransacetylase
MDAGDSDALVAVRAREDALYAAMIALDYAALDELLSDELSYVHSTGVTETKSGYLVALRRGLYEYAAITRCDGDTQVFGACAVTRGTIDMLVGAAGSAKDTIRLRHVLVWVKQEAKWCLTLRQATRIPT